MKALCIDLHGWRGLGPYRDLFLRGVVLGFVTVSLSEVEMRQRMQKYDLLLKKMAAGAGAKQ